MNFNPEYLSLSAMHSWEKYSANMRAELRQCLDEGRDVEGYRELSEAIANLPDGVIREELANVFFEAMQRAPMRADYPYVEPDALDAIQAARPENRPVLGTVNADTLKDKIRGAWLGRICGCLLGKPVEGMRTPDMHELLKNSGNFPLTRYMTLEDVKKTPRLLERWEKRTWADCLGKGNNYSGYPNHTDVPCAPTDDDTNYTVMAAYGIVGRFGRDFTPDQVATAWMDCQPKNAYCTAERRAFRNFVIGLRPPQSAMYKNPDREFIGAQIRADYFGYINPGDPQTAADMAWRDACISHVKNGIYGEMFVAAMIAAAAVTDDVVEIVKAGLGEIPAKSRLTAAVNNILSEYQSGKSEDECFAGVASRWDEFKGYDWVHTISNAEIVAAALLYGQGDYTHSICRAVQTGFDTDCNGATVGSIVGMMRGSSAVGEEWTAPIHGALATSIFGIDLVTIDQLVDKTMEHLA